MDYSYKFRTLCDIPGRNVSLFPGRISHKFRSPDGFICRNFRDFYGEILALTAGFVKYGLKNLSTWPFFPTTAMSGP